MFWPTRNLRKSKHDKEGECLSVRGAWRGRSLLASEPMDDGDLWGPILLSRSESHS